MTSADDNPPTILFLPDFSGSNPYQANLASTLGDRGVVVTFGDVHGLFRIWRSVRDAGDIDIVHLHWLSPYIQGTTLGRTLLLSVLTVVQLTVLRSLGVSVVWTIHNLTPHKSGFPRIDRWVVGLIVRICDRVVVHCEAVETELAERYGHERTQRRTRVVPHGHFIENYENVISRTEARDALSLDMTGRVFLHFGRLRRYKGVHRLIDAFRDVASEDSRLLIVGAPHDREYAAEVQLRATGDDRVRTVLEFVPDEEVQVYMNAADAVVLPYREIATSGAAVLAMSFGKAVITPAAGCNPELIGDRGGFLYASDSDDGLRTAIREAETVDLESIGNRNRRAVRGNDWERIARLTEAVYREVR